MELFDTHCHLDAEAFDQDREAVIARAKAAGITRLVVIGASNGLESALQAIALAEKNSTIWATVGVHPHDGDSTADPKMLENMAAHPRVVAIGETGLDFHYSFAVRDNQERWFRSQINLAKKVKKPLVIHCRNAGKETLQILKDEDAREAGGVFHCYSEDEDFAKELFDINFIVSFPGVLTFKKSEATRAVAKGLPLDKIMLETDAPFLAPEPFRGKRCESAFMVETAKVLAQLHGKSLDELAAVTTANALRFYRITDGT